MLSNRRYFLKTSAAAGAAIGLGGSLIPDLASATSIPTVKPEPQVRPKRLLILGGTGFIGPHMVEYALGRGHTVTLFNRGRTNTHLFPTVEKLVGDRNNDISALEGREWDVVLDNHSTLPRWVRMTAQLLKDSAEQYVHVSSISVYATDTAELNGWKNTEPGSPERERMRIDEESALMQLPDGHEDEEVTGRTFGPFKALAEQEAREAFPGRATIVRPGLIVGPRDRSDRFTYWPARIDRGGEIMVPGNGRDEVQLIDVRDLTSWIVRLAENGVTGTFNGTGPEGRLSMAGLVYGIRAVTSSPVRFTWADAHWLAEHEVRPWSDMPVWMPDDPQSYVRIDRALEQGLTFRPLADTSLDTLEWHKSRSAERRAELRAGLAPEREAELLRALHEQR